jgi:hypothetical protein
VGDVLSITRVCPVCEEDKLVSEFYVDRTRRDGLFPYCKPCQRQRMRDRYAENPEPIREQIRRSSAKYRARLRSDAPHALMQDEAVEEEVAGLGW